MLNKDQEQALREFIRFLASPTDKHMILSGPAGAGKGYLLRYIEENWNVLSLKANILNPDINISTPVFTATTNEAVFQLGVESATTIYSKAGLVPGVNKLRAIKAVDMTPQLIFVDEASYIDKSAFEAITAQLPKSKFVWVMDQDQLAPVGSAVPYITTLPFPTAELTTIERNKGDLQDLVKELRLAVRNKHGVDLHRHHNNTTITVVDSTEFQNQIIKEFSTDYTRCKVVMFKNATVSAYNNAIHQNVLKQPEFPHEGAPAIINSYSREARYRVGTRCFLNKVEQTTENFPMHSAKGYEDVKVEVWNIHSTLGYILYPCNVSNKAIWKLSPEFVDISLPYASTTHKAQGSTIPIVFVDAKEIFSSFDAEMRRRLLYVAVSRASEKVIICI